MQIQDILLKDKDESECVNVGGDDVDVDDVDVDECSGSVTSDTGAVGHLCQSHVLTQELF